MIDIGTKVSYPYPDQTSIAGAPDRLISPEKIKTGTVTGHKLGKAIVAPDDGSAPFPIDENHLTVL
jgi:hypothetical protein